jgi:hypothetical protein
MCEDTQRALAWSSRAIPLSNGVLMDYGVGRSLSAHRYVVRFGVLLLLKRNVSCLGVWTKREISREFPLRDHTRRAWGHARRSPIPAERCLVSRPASSRRPRRLRVRVRPPGCVPLPGQFRLPFYDLRSHTWSPGVGSFCEQHWDAKGESKRPSPNCTASRSYTSRKSLSSGRPTLSRPPSHRHATQKLQVWLAAPEASGVPHFVAVSARSRQHAQLRLDAATKRRVHAHASVSGVSPFPRESEASGRRLADGGSGFAALSTAWPVCTHHGHRGRVSGSGASHVDVAWAWGHSVHVRCA